MSGETDEKIMKGLYFEDFGDSRVLHYGELADPQICETDLLVAMDYIGLNFADIYRRRGGYHIEEHTPHVNGYEGVGRIVALGNQVSGHQVGDTILFVDVPFANAELVAVPQSHAITVPPKLETRLAASIGLQGLTADFLAHDLGKCRPGDKVLIQGISGGVGQILSQLLIAEGVSVYGVTSSVAKQEVALSQGAQDVFLRDAAWEKDHLNMFDTVFDGVGTTLNQSINLVKNKGNVVFFGMSGGTPPPVNLVNLLARSKSILTGDLWDYLTDHTERSRRSRRLFDYFIEGKIAVSEPTIFALSDGKQAHDFLESGKNIGKVLLVP